MKFDPLSLRLCRSPLRHPRPPLAFAAVVLVFFGACALSAQGDNPGQSSTENMRNQNEVAEFSERPTDVLGALTSVLVRRGELSADAVEDTEWAALTALQEEGRAEVSSESKQIGAQELKALVRTESHRYVTERGGRYVLNIMAEALPNGGTRLTVKPTLVAFVRGMDGPLGGRPLPSNGALELAVLTAVSQALQGR
ncbi:MAG: hypothetical protein JSU87_14605 [Gemmatimonadota bacterium]|nr:MAG: hypothetical protein JSU87_14605 [Gemmatimonadota bacterium]